MACKALDFYPRPPRGGRQRLRLVAAQRHRFLSTPSARRATKFAMLGDQSNIISIHALREEGDSLSMCRCPTASDFYPRPPRGGRPAAQVTPHEMPNFYPRPPRGGRLAVLAFSALLAAISIHALREEGDRRGYRDRPDPVDFYPRPPRGGRQRLRLVAAQRHRFLSTPSARRATRSYCQPGKGPDISIHALREEGDRHLPPGRGQRRGFLSTPSARRATTG